MTTESMKPYPAYKDSGIEWIGEIPEGWDVRKLKWVVKGQLKYGANEVAELDDKEYPRYIRITDFGNDGKLKHNSFKSLPFDKAKDYFLNEGDVLFARSGATVGKTFQFKNYNGLACFAGYLIKASPQTDVLSSDFLYYFTKSNTYENWKNSIFIQATIQNIGADKYNLLQVPIPNFDEQQSIATFLDNQTIKIDTLIENKQKQIELLKEERTAIINQAVTKGLNPDVPMRDSGIEWLGEIPEHWEIAGFTKYLESIIDYRGRTPTKTDEGVFLVTAKNVKSGMINYNLSQEFVSPEICKFIMQRGLPKKGDVLFTTEAPLGEVANVDNELIALAQRIIKFRGKSEYLNNYFLKHWLLSYSFQSDLHRYATGSTALGIKASKLNKLKIVLPTIDEQKQIVDFIDSTLAKADKIISQIQNQITLLQEYRTALISEAVTGKIDLRNQHVITTPK